LPKDAQILTVQCQRDILCLWALVDDGTSLKQSRTFEIVGTGHPVENYTKRQYIGTAQQYGGSLIWHVFEVLRED
jgi:hypothetical protein